MALVTTRTPISA